MQRYPRHRPGPLFRGPERMRLMTMIVMLGVLGMLIMRARDPQTWRWFAGEDERLSPRILDAQERDEGRAPATVERKATLFNHRRPHAAPARAKADSTDAAQPGFTRTAAISREGVVASGDASPRADAALYALAMADRPAAPEAPASDQTRAGDAPAAPTPAAAPAPAAAVPPVAKNGSSSAAGLADDVPPPSATLDPRFAERPATSAMAPVMPVTPVTPVTTPAANADGPAPGAAPVDPPPAKPPGERSSPAAASLDAARAATLAPDVPPPDATLDPRYTDAPASEASPGSAEYQQPVAMPPDSGAPAPKPEDLAPDRDPIEIEEFEYEAAAVTDKEVLQAAEMPAYWRLVDWEMKQTFRQLDKRARKDLTFAHLFKDPEKYRGKLVQLKLRVGRAVAHDADENGKARDLKRAYELWGVTDESSPSPYTVLVTDLPADFPLRHNMQEDVTFAGYFFKLMAYKSHDDKMRAAPMLIGRVFWHQTVPVTLPFDSTWLWVGGLGLAAAVMLAARLSFNMTPWKPRGLLPPLADGEQNVPIETWLEKIEESESVGGPPPLRLAMNGHADEEPPTNGAAHHPADEFEEDPGA